jgi:hypothetical protein
MKWGRSVSALRWDGACMQGACARAGSEPLLSRAPQQYTPHTDWFGPTEATYWGEPSIQAGNNRFATLFLCTHALRRAAHAPGFRCDARRAQTLATSRRAARRASRASAASRARVTRAT